ncbi:amino acid adenylation domain-containing protein [Paenibacillus sp. MER TA 81-3]|nr:amino acid adenylation domain-containing protein [Paenibacillus sp. MER TA 81-3]
MSLNHIEDFFPLSPMQQGMLFHSLYAPESGVCVIQSSLNFKGELDPSAWNQAWVHIVQRHAILRASFISDDVKEPIQVVNRDVTLSQELLDWRSVPEQEQPLRLEAYLQADRSRGFVLSEPPLLRLALIQMAEQRYTFVITIHHLLVDGWSLGILFREVFTQYECFRAGTEAMFDASRPYRDHIAWLKKQDMSKVEAFWRDNLRGYASPTPIAIGRTPAAAEQQSDERSITLPANITAELQAFSRRNRMTLNTLLQGAWAIVLSRNSGEEDVVFGSVVSGRPHDLPRAESIVGLFINTLPVRVQVPGPASVVDWFREFQAYQTQLRQYEHSPLLQVQNWSELPKGQRLFDSIVVFENYPIDGTVIEQYGKLKLEAVQSFEQTGYPLTIVALPGPTFEIQMLYACDRFTGDAIERLLEQLKTVLTSIVHYSERTLADLPSLPEAECQKLLHEWNDTALSLALTIPVHQGMARKAQEKPDQIAVSCADASITYRELDERSNQLARFLQQVGIGKGSLVGICVERSIELIIGLLGILKAGGAYVPLDPEYPKERLQFILEDTEVQVLITQQRLQDRLPHHRARTILLDAEWEQLEQYASQAFICEADLDDVAYVIYTSGSTGRPKGVEITHNALLNLVNWHQQAYEVTDADRATLLAGTAFDASVWEIWPYVTAGASLFIPDEDTRLIPEQLRDWIAEHRITISFMPTPIGERMLGLEWPQHISLRVMLVGGDKLHRYPVQQLPFQLFNNYGPTENTVVSTSGFVPVRTDSEEAPTIGRPIANTQAFILDRHLQVVPVGAVGELYVAGKSLARGYWRQPELTAERFIRNPFETSPDDRMYATGDLCRYRADGEIEYIGRKDDQVKIRGFRIELGEVETVLALHPAVSEALAIVRHTSAGDPRLVVYVTLAASNTMAVLASELRQYVKERLPDYMVPASFMILDAFPLTPNGKVDRKALPEPDLTLESEIYVAPRSETEQQFAQIWSDVLGIEPIGIHDNYFSLGGDSILSIQIVSRAKKQGLHITPKQLFAHPTIAELAQAAVKAPTAAAAQGIVEGAVTLTPIQRWFFEQELMAPLHFNQGMVLTVNPKVSPDALREAIGHLVAHHDALRLQFTKNEDGWVQHNAGISGQIPFSIIDLSHVAQGQQAAALERAANVAQRSIQLDEGNLLKSIYFQLGEGIPGRLLLIIHHLGVDGVSWRILLEDLHTVCEQLLSNESVELPDKTTSFQEWAEKLTHYAHSEEVRADAAYWFGERNKYEPSFPVDRVEGPSTVAAAEQTIRMLSAEETRQLLQDVPAAYRTQINDVLLTALARTMAWWSGERKLLLHLEGHGREEVMEGVDLSRTVGWFTSMYPLLLELSDQDEVSEQLKSMKEQLRAVPSRGLTYGLLRYVAQLPMSGQFPSPKLSFNYLGQFDQTLGTSGDSLFSGAVESMGAEVDPSSVRQHLLDLSGMIVGGSLHLAWTYSRNNYNSITIEQLADRYMEELSVIMAHCQKPDAVGVTPSDFPLAKVTQQQLDQVYAHNQTMQDIFPLTPMQEGMLFHSLEAPEASMYCEQSVFTLQGSFEVQPFTQAWQQVMARHAILRTSVVWEGLERPHLVLYDEVPVNVEILDYRLLPAKERMEMLQSLLVEDRRRGFDFTKPPLMRFTIVRLEDNVNQFIWTFHHLLLDGWSVPLVIREFFLLYEAHAEGTTVSLHQVPSYRDYIAWLDKQDQQAAEGFWKSYLLGMESPTSIMGATAADREEAQYDEIMVGLGTALTSELDSFARSQQLTLSTLIQGAWSLLLSRYSGESDVMFGTTVAGRPASLDAVETMVGLFINTLPVRVHIEPHKQVLQWLHELQEVQTDMRQYEYASLAQVHSWSEVPRGTPLFESLVVYENYPVLKASSEAAATTAELETESAEKLELLEIRAYERTNYPITVTVIPGHELELRVGYDAHRYSEATMRQITVHLERILAGIMQQSQGSIRQVPMLIKDEERLLLQDWNNTAGSYPRDKTVHELFDQQAARTPDAIALIFGSEQLTYRELQARANQIARYLHKLGVGPDVPVGIAMERSFDAIAGLLGILKAGGAYVPLDPDYPTERLTFMMEETNVSLLLTQERLQNKLPVTAAKVILLDQQWEIAELSTEAPESSSSAEHLAYVIYTSGSTGRPKGVSIPHRGIVRLVKGLDFARFGHGEVMLQFAPISFDASTFEVWGSLLNGGTLAIMPPGLPSVQELGDYMQTCKVTVAWLTAPLFHTMVEENLDGLRQLKQLWAGGDALSMVHVQKALALDGLELINGYGPTENTTFTCCYRFPQEIDSIIPIGRPITGTTCYILDENKNMVPIGMPGELYVGGDGLAHGYLQQPELTAEKFVDNPFVPGERLYRTGDLVRYMPDGNIEFLGRFDHQVKIRGFRIEPGEIENEISSHPDVSQSVVIAQANGFKEKRLVAYAVQAHAGGQLIGDILRAYLKERVPDYMVPSIIIVLDELPLLPSGKVNRNALPAPEFISSQGYVAPTEEAERILAEIWSNVLGVEQVGIHDNFFELGGDSILSIQIVARASQAGLKLTPKQLFQYQTITELVTIVESTTTVQAEQGLVQGALPLTPVQRWFFELPLVNRDHWNQSFMLQLHSQSVRPHIVKQMIEHLINHHDALRMRFNGSEQDWTQFHGDLTEVPFAHFDLSQVEENEQSVKIEEIASSLQASLSLSDGIMIRAALFELGGDRPARLFLVIHHLVVDGVSWRILLEDAERIYNQLAEGHPVELPAKTTSFRQWAHLLDEEAAKGACRQQLEYWENMAMAWVPRLPLDYPASDDEIPALNTLESSEVISIQLDTESTLRLLQDVPAVYRTRIDEVLLTALLASMERWTGSSTLLIHLEGHGREDIVQGADLSRTVGWFTSIYPVLLDGGFDTEPVSRLLTVKEQLRAIPDRGVSYGILRYMDQGDLGNSLAQFPAVEVSYNYLGQMSSMYQQDGLFQPAPESGGMTQEPSNSRQHLIDVAGMVVNNQLQMMITYSTNLHHKSTIEQVADDFAETLHAIIANCNHSAADTFTPSDFPEAGLSQKELDLIMKKMHGGRNS